MQEGASCAMIAARVATTGTFATPEHVFLETFALAGSGSVTVQTYGFGGGVIAAGTVPLRRF